MSDHKNFQKWQKLEIAKHRLIYQLDRLNLPYFSKLKNRDQGVCFDFLSRSPSHNRMTGHANGVITILLEEADSVHLEKMKSELSEPYRTLIGHFRHEVGHYFWDLLIAKEPENLQIFRSIFGDERIDYGQALVTYYQSKSGVNWKDAYITQYASSHPWEDWAETWAHYLHIMDMAETAYSFGITIKPKLNEVSLQGEIHFDPYVTTDFNQIFNAWFPISFAINSLNRSMGIADAYPFVINGAVIKKMKFIHRLLFGKS
ncbi:MAG TPA: putative zinc-binding metallopeptidase [Algoriphagus sp.]|nr:putative zinc-binding metallopeptidase [Algoriphagus sp.]